MENEIQNDVTAQENEDSTEILLEKYDSPTHRKADDVPAMQTVLCVIISAVIFALNAFYPEKGGEIFTKLKELSFSQHEVIPNPIDLIVELI